MSFVSRGKNYFCSMDTFTDVIKDWYAENKRDLPWRKTTDPYLVWVSEIILQQTRVAQGYGYFLRFVERFPDVPALAEASEDEVLKYWQGLGYYTRARNMHTAARSMDGAFPRTYEGVLALKGVGEYTAAAICSIAYSMPYAVVDGNVYRVLSRYYGIDVPVDSTKGKKLFAALAQEMLDKIHPGVYNQAIMDFGALQCTPQAPDCMFCPLVDTCEAFRLGKVAQLPVKQHKTRTTNRYFTYIYVKAGPYTYIRKRTADDIWKNLFEFPLIESDGELSDEAFLASPQLQGLLAGEKRYTIRPVCRNVKHVLSHRVIHAAFYELLLPEDTPACRDYLRIRREERGQYAVPRLIQAFWEKYG